MERPFRLSTDSGFSLIETLVVLVVLAVCLGAGGMGLARGLRAAEARGAAEVWQAAAAWAQVGAVWQGETRALRFEAGRISVARELGADQTQLACPAPPAPVFANIVRWRQGQGVVVRFTGGTGAPDSAGSLYFRALASDYRVVVRLESGLTARTRVESLP